MKYQWILEWKYIGNKTLIFFLMPIIFFRKMIHSIHFLWRLSTSLSNCFLTASSVDLHVLLRQLNQEPAFQNLTHRRGDSNSINLVWNLSSSTHSSSAAPIMIYFFMLDWVVEILDFIAWFTFLLAGVFFYWLLWIGWSRFSFRKGLQESPLLYVKKERINWDVKYVRIPGTCVINKWVEKFERKMNAKIAIN